MNIEYTKLESIHCALQELQQEFNIPNDHEPVSYTHLTLPTNREV